MKDKNYQRYRERLLITAVIIILMFLIGFTSGGRNSITIVERAIGDVLTPFISVCSKAVLAVKSGIDDVASIPKIISENRELQEQNKVLEAENLKLTDIVSRSDYLKNEYELISKTDFEVVNANIVGKSSSQYDKYLLDKGSSSGIKKDDTVIVGIKSSENLVVEGLVGKVEEVGDNWSKISLIIGENNSISFSNIRTQDGGILNRSDGKILEGYMFDHQSDIIADDRIYTSGLGETYVSRIYIGRVTNVITDSENLKKTLTVMPAVDFDKLNKVMVIIGEKYE